MITLQGRTFQNRDAAKNFIRQYLTDLEGSMITITDKEWAFFDELLSRHPEQKIKRGCGISQFLVGRSAFGHIELNLLRIDGSKSDISWQKCLTGARTSEQDLRAALRVEINSQIKVFKEANFDPQKLCGICREELKDIKKVHVDHILPFEELVVAFLRANPLTPRSFAEEPLTNRKKFREEDKDFAARWSQYHLEKATLRLVHDYCNLRRKK